MKTAFVRLRSTALQPVPKYPLWSHPFLVHRVSPVNQRFALSIRLSRFLRWS